MVRPDGSIDWNLPPYTGFAAFVKVAAERLKVAVSQGAYWKFLDAPHTELANFRKA